MRGSQTPCEQNFFDWKLDKKGFCQRIKKGRGFPVTRTFVVDIREKVTK